MPQESLLKTEALCVGYGQTTLIRDIDLNLQRGRILVLLGPNGAGKSTILKTITGHLPNLGGKIFLDGKVRAGLSRKQLAQEISVVLTERMKTERMLCQDVVETGRYPHTGYLGRLTAHDHAVVERVMQQTEIWSLRNRDFGQLSDGQRQRVLLARALAQEPSLLVLDEPTTFLDIRYQIELLGILQTMAKEKQLAVMLSLHELPLAQRIADDVLCVKGEEILAYGSAEEIFQTERIRVLYDLTEGSYNPLLGTLEMQKPKGKVRCFVVGGGGSGILAYRQLQKQNMAFYAGILHKNDLDYPVASALAEEVFAEEAFMPISEEMYTQARAGLAQCEILLYLLPRVGEMNQKNAVLLEEAKRKNIQIIYDLNDMNWEELR